MMIRGVLPVISSINSTVPLMRTVTPPPIHTFVIFNLSFISMVFLQFYNFVIKARC